MAGRKKRRQVQGVVVSDRMNKTRVVLVGRQVKHRRYGKYVRQRTRLHAHDERNESREGDVVEIMETRPLSRMKRWRLVRVVRRKGERPGAAAVGDGVAEPESKDASGE